MDCTGFGDARLLRSAGVDCDDGLTAGELAAAEERCGCRFPPDLAAMLRECVPVGDGFPNWRDLGGPDLVRRLGWPAWTIAEDVRGGAWCEAWGTRPSVDAHAACVAVASVHAAPRLIPLFSHRFLPCEPCEARNAVLSVWGTDLCVYGDTLPAYLRREFVLPETAEPWHDYRPTWRRTRFWGDLVDARGWTWKKS